MVNGRNPEPNQSPRCIPSPRLHQNHKGCISQSRSPGPDPITAQGKEGALGQHRARRGYASLLQGVESWDPDLLSTGKWGGDQLGAHLGIQLCTFTHIRPAASVMGGVWMLIGG